MSGEITTKHEHETPKWLNEDFFEKILQSSEKDPSIKITSLSTIPAAINNDHYASVMYRSSIEYSRSDGEKCAISLIVKSMPEVDGKKKEMLKDTFIFKTEINMYSKAIPKMEAVLRKYGDDTVLGARVLYATLQPHEVIVFEDLVDKGYFALKNRMPTEEEVKLAILKLAKWHAVSYKLAQEDPESVKNFNDGVYSLDMKKFEFFENGIKMFMKVLSSDDELKKYVPLFEEYDKNIMNLLANMGNAYKRGDNPIMILNHGDFHFKNMMFKHKKSGELDDIMLVDFQMCYYGPAISDLLYSMYMLWDSDMRVNRRDEMISYYFTNFIDSLKKYEYKGKLPKMADLQIDLINYRGFEVFLMACYMPFKVAFSDANVDLDKLAESAEARMKVYLMPSVLEELRTLVPRYVQRGYLEL